MPARFPGIDPYIESQHYWPDFHQTFLTYLREAISDRLPEDYEARLDERVNLVENEDADRVLSIRPDVAVTHRPGMSRPEGGVAVLEPVTIPTVMMDEDRQAFLKVLHRPDRKLVAVVELLSPANKVNPGHRDYLARRNALLWQDVHLVELDFLSGGQRLPMRLPLPAGDFYALVAHADRRPDCEVYAWTLRDRLPTILIPLLGGDPSVLLDLASVYATAFERGRYARSIAYRESLAELNLDPETRSWAEGRGREAG
jgi:hypothetical protein